MSTHTPAISGAMAAHTFRGIAIFLIVTHLSLSTPFITTPRPLLPLSLKLPSTSRNYHVCQALFSFVLVRQCGPSCQFPVFSSNVRDGILRGMEASYRLPCCGVTSSIDDSSCHLSGIPDPFSWWLVRHFALILNLKMSLMQPCFHRPGVHLLSTSPVMAM